jgi:hypothetical protein
MRYTYEYLDSNFLESTSFFLSRELYLIMEDSHTRYGLIVSVGCGDPGSGNARARAKNHEKFCFPFSQSCLISAPHYGTHHFEARNCVLYAAHSTGGNGYAHNTMAADVSNDQHKSALDSAPGHANWESTTVFRLSSSLCAVFTNCMGNTAHGWSTYSLQRILHALSSGGRT